MASSNEDSEDSFSSPMSLRYLPPPSLPPITTVFPYTHRVYIPDRYEKPMVYPDDNKLPYQNQYTLNPIVVHDYRSYAMSHNYERPPQVLPSQETPLPGISSVLANPHSDSPDSPMQLDFILNGSDEPSSPAPSSSRQTTITQSSESHSPCKPIRPRQPPETEPDINSSILLPPPESQLQLQSTSVSHTHASTTRQTITRFEAITAHTAKCDLCNRRNDAGMSRCLACGWQSCHSCSLKNGSTRTHKAGSRVHTGPIDPRELVKRSTTGTDTAASGNRTASRGTKPRARGRGRGRGRGTSSSRMDSERERANERERERENIPADVDSSQRPDLAMAEGARDLFAFVLQAYIEWTQEQKGKGREDPDSDWGVYADVEDVHSYAQEEANKVYGRYSQDG